MARTFGGDINMEELKSIAGEEREMLYTLSVNLEYFANEMERAKSFYHYGKKADDYAGITKMMKLTCLLVKEKLNELEVTE